MPKKKFLTKQQKEKIVEISSSLEKISRELSLIFPRWERHESMNHYMDNVTTGLKGDIESAQQHLELLWRDWILPLQHKKGQSPLPGDEYAPMKSPT